MKSKAVLIGTMAILAIFVGTSAFSNSAYAASIDVTCAAPPGQDPAPSNGTALNYAVINNNNIDFTGRVRDDLWGNIFGWNPNGIDTKFTVGGIPNVANIDSVIAVSTDDLGSFNVCGVSLVRPVGLEGFEGFEGNITKSMNTTASK